MIELRDFLEATTRIVERHRLEQPGTYRRWLWQDEAGGRDLGCNAYGCADAANLLYTVGAFPAAAAWPAWIAELQRMQEPESGLFLESTHHPLHTTAHVAGALELFDARPARPLSALAGMKTRTSLEEFLDGLDWAWNPWGESHRGAGLYAALVLAGEAPDQWREWYFDWLWREADAETGLWRSGRVAAGGDAMLFHHLAGSFHYLFNHQHAGRRLRYPQRMVDTCMRIFRNGLFPPLAKTVGFAEIDWVYCLHRALRQCGHRAGECRAALAEFAEAYTRFLSALDPERDEGLNDLHQLLGAVSALAELQQALPEMLRSDPPLRLVLDRRPFI